MNNVTRLFDFPYHQLEKYNLADSLVTKYGNEWVKTSTQEYIDKANAISRGLLKLGVNKNDKIAVISSNNRTEWHICDIGVLQIGAQNVPIYPTISSEDYEYILKHSESTYCFISDIEVYNKIKKIKANVPGLKEIYSFNDIEGCKNWNDILTLGNDISTQNEVEERKNNVLTTDLSTIIYTSGTTGRPKGVMLSHQNIVSDVLMSATRVPLRAGDTKALSFLPICHVFERMLTYLYQYYGISIYFAESIEKISDNLKEVNPHVMSVVPRLLEKVYDKIYAKGDGLSGIKKVLFFWALDLGMEYKPYGENGWWYEFKLKIARKLIFSKWQEGLGGQLELLVCGSAALQTRLTKVFCAANIPVMEGYGLTETSPVITVNDMRNKGFRVGSVGKVLEGVDIKIAEDGEILCKGPNVMIGYYKDEAQTNEVIKNGYFHTGDIGEIDSDGFLKITDRKKEMFKTSGGKYVAPQVLENTFKQSRFIEQIMVIGDGEKMPAAFIQPNFDFIKDWAKRKNIVIGNSNEEIASNKDVIARVQEEVNFANESFGNWEKVKRFELTGDVWGIDSGHLTPTMKLKRKVIKELYINLYNKIYTS
jgi:long-chain acyl-CoA synthetase